MYRDPTASAAARASLQNFARLAAGVCAAPLALITLNDPEHAGASWGWKNGDGPTGSFLQAYRIDRPGVLVVEDLQTDRTLAAHPFTTEHPEIHFLAATTIVGLGTLWVMDTSVRTLSTEQAEFLATVADQIATHVALEQRAMAADGQTLEMQRALAHSEALHSCLVQQIPQRVIRKDVNGRFTFANARYCESLGIALEDIVGKTDFDLFPEEEALRHLAGDRAVIESGEQFEALEAHGTPAGTTHLHVTKTPVRDSAGRIIEILGILGDVTASKIMEEELRYERDLLHALLDTLPDSVYFKDLESRFLRISTSLAARIGLADPLEAIGKTDADFFGGEHAQAALEDERRIINTGEPLISKMECETSVHGRDFWVNTTKMPLRNSAGTIVGTLGLSRDVTELKHAEEDLAVARDVALESARLKSEFLANMSHEIRTPLNAVVGMSGLLLDTPLDPEQKDFAETIRSSADLLLGIINDVLDFSKIEAGKMSIETIDFDLTQVIEETADLLADRAQSKGIELATWTPPHVPRGLRGDPGRIRQVLANLISNAVKFTDRGEVIVQVGLTHETPRDVTLRVEIRDTGIGIPADAQTKLFNAFTQADGSTTRRYGGTGLGLAICKQLVGLMGGDIGFDSMPGHGSTFWFTLTLERQTAPIARREAPPLPLDGVRVLIVDDNQTNREILRHQVAAWKMRHGSAKDGPEAMACLYRELGAGDPYTLVILDMQMPDMDGMDVARAINADPKLRGTHIVILTSLAYHPEDGDFRRLGISAYLTKPVKQSRLFDCLATVMNEGDAPAEPAIRTGATKVVPASLAPRRTTRVLLAEDNAVNQKVAIRQLLKLGFVAHAVGDGEEVLAAIERAPYDVILMDCQMPLVDGYEATRRIREREAAHPEEPRHYIIAVTAHALDGDREVCLRAGMDDYLSKPLRLDELGRALERSTASRGVVQAV